MRAFASAAVVAAACAGAVTCAGAATGARAAADDGTVTLSITGGEGVRVRGRCLVEASGGDQSLELDETVPVERHWPASGLRCVLEAQGPVTVEAVRGGSRSRSSTSGGRIVLDLR